VVSRRLQSVGLRAKGAAQSPEICTSSAGGITWPLFTTEPNSEAYVDGVQDGAAQVHLTPQRAGRTSVGVRLNKVFYFKGAVRVARFTRRALPPSGVSEIQE